MAQYVNGKFIRHELIITPETDLENPMVLNYIKDWQQWAITNSNETIADRPPQPHKIRGSTKKDWRPLWEWALRHPQVTRKEISKMLKINYTEVKRKLEELDSGGDPPPFSLLK